MNTCKAHSTGTATATSCLSCTLARTPCTHPYVALYCTPCAAVYDIVRGCVSTPHPLTATDYEVWAVDSVHGAPLADLRLIAGWLAGWTLLDGTPWPIDERDAIPSSNVSASR